MDSTQSPPASPNPSTAPPAPATPPSPRPSSPVPSTSSPAHSPLDSPAVLDPEPLPPATPSPASPVQQPAPTASTTPSSSTAPSSSSLHPHPGPSSASSSSASSSASTAHLHPAGAGAASANWRDRDAVSSSASGGGGGGGAATAGSSSSTSHGQAHAFSAAGATNYANAEGLTHYLQSSFVPSVVPQQDEYQAKEQARVYLEKLAEQVSPGARLLPFGSMANGFALKNSDMDLCCFLLKDAAVRSPSELVELLGRLIEQETNFYVKMLPRARIPIIKLTMPPTPAVPAGMACDIGFENRLALENTRLLLTYALVDTRLRTLVLFLKVWTKRRKINNPYRGTLSSYGYVLLVIHFLASVKQPAILP
ncbi:hypothetical protein JCM6882_008643, partial [Rhodosporidiobolus microsporus]